MGSLCSCFDEEVEEEEEVIEDLKTSHRFSRSDFNFVTLQSPPKEAAAEWKVNYNGVTTPPKKPVIYNHMTEVTPPKRVVPLPTLLKASREAPAEKTSAPERLGEDASGARVTCSKETQDLETGQTTRQGVDCVLGEGGAKVNKAQKDAQLAQLEQCIKNLRECAELVQNFQKKSQVIIDQMDIREEVHNIMYLHPAARKKALRSLQLRWHPDKTSGTTTAQYQVLQNMIDTMSDA